MKRFLIPVAVIAGAFTLTACTGTVGGSVERGSDGRGVSRARVLIGDESVMTDERGRFRFEKVPTGAATLTVEASGFPAMTRRVDVERGSKAIDLILDDAVLEGRLAEKAVEPTKTGPPDVAVDGATVTPRPDGSFLVKGLPPGAHRVDVRLDRHEDFSTTLTLSPGRNEMTATLTLTAEETFRRYFQAMKFQRMDSAYRYLHPDVKKRMTKSEFSYSPFGAGGPPQRLEITESRMLPEWRSRFTRKGYSDVAELDATQYHYMGPDSLVQHLVKVDGLWNVVFDMPEPPPVEPVPVPEPAPIPEPEDGSEPPATEPAVPFWGAFFYANEVRSSVDAKAAEAEAAGFTTVVLNTADHGTIGDPGQSIWVVCAGPFEDEAEASDAAERLKAAGFEGAYAKRVDD